MRIETLLEERCVGCAKTQEDHEIRLDVLEKSEERRKGMGIVIGSVAAGAATVSAIVVEIFSRR